MVSTLRSESICQGILNNQIHSKLSVWTDLKVVTAAFEETEGPDHSCNYSSGRDIDLSFLNLSEVQTC